MIERLRQWLDERHMTQGALAEKLGLHPVYVRAILSGNDTLSAGFILRFAQVFGWELAGAIFNIERMP